MPSDAQIDWPFTPTQQERMAFEDHVRTREGGKDMAVMHDFIRKQAINQEADYSVRDMESAREPDDALSVMLHFSNVDMDIHPHGTGHPGVRTRKGQAAKGPRLIASLPGSKQNSCWRGGLCNYTRCGKKAKHSVVTSSVGWFLSFCSFACLFALARWDAERLTFFTQNKKELEYVHSADYLEIRYRTSHEGDAMDGSCMYKASPGSTSSAVLCPR